MEIKVRENFEFVTGKRKIRIIIMEANKQLFLCWRSRTPPRWVASPFLTSFTQDFPWLYKRYPEGRKELMLSERISNRLDKLKPKTSLNKTKELVRKVGFYGLFLENHFQRKPRELFEIHQYFLRQLEKLNKQKRVKLNEVGVPKAGRKRIRRN
ncbi:MAG: hypothetical protein ABIE23_04645 [archaeon]